MKVKIGDKVKFLNESGGGVVSRIINPALVHVMIEDGFEIPTAIDNLILIDLSEPAGRFFNKDMKVPFTQPPESDSRDDALPVERISRLSKLPGKKTTPQGIYLAFIPHDQKWLITGPLDIYIINNTEFDVTYSYFLIENDGSYTGMDTDQVPAFSKIYLQTIDREEIRDWNQGIIQVLFFRENLQKVPLPASCSFNLRDNKFISEENYVSSSILVTRAILSVVVEMTKHSSVSPRESVGRKGSTEPALIPARDFREPPLIDKHKLATGVAEVDLHIEELVEDEKGLDAEKILRIQLDYFIKCLESALSNHYQKVIFIHGVGNGTLKSEIRMMLDTYQGIEHHTATMAKYGVGAIEVIIKHNR